MSRYNLTAGQRLKKLLSQKGMTQIELSDKIKIPKGTLNCYFVDRTQPDFDTLIQLADALDTTVEYIVTGKKINKSQLIGELAATLEDAGLRVAYQKLLELNEDNLELAAGHIDLLLNHQQKK